MENTTQTESPTWTVEVWFAMGGGYVTVAVDCTRAFAEKTARGYWDDSRGVRIARIHADGTDEIVTIKPEARRP